MRSSFFLREERTTLLLSNPRKKTIIIGRIADTRNWEATIQIKAKRSRCLTKGYSILRPSDRDSRLRRSLKWMQKTCWEWAQNMELNSTRTSSRSKEGLKKIDSRTKSRSKCIMLKPKKHPITKWEAVPEGLLKNLTRRKERTTM